MPKIVFWSPSVVSNGQTHASIAVSTLMAIEEDYSNILLHAHWQARKIESAFTEYSSLKAQNVFNTSSIGITALSRLVESNKLTPESIRNYAKPVLKQRLDIMYGTNVDSREQFNQLTNTISMVIGVSNQTYDLVWVDLPKGTEREYIKKALEDADYIICTIRQEQVHIDEVMKEYLENEIIKNKPKMLLMCDYEPKSKYNIPNIRRKYGIKDDIKVLPHNYVFTDACNDGTVVDFFYKNLGADKNDYNGYFINEVRDITKTVLNHVKI